MTPEAYEMMDVAAQAMSQEGVNGPYTLAIGPSMARSWSVSHGDAFWLHSIGTEISIVVANEKEGGPGEITPVGPFGVGLEPKRVLH